MVKMSKDAFHRTYYVTHDYVLAYEAFHPAVVLHAICTQITFLKTSKDSKMHLALRVSDRGLRTSVKLCT